MSPFRSALPYLTTSLTVVRHEIPDLRGCFSGVFRASVVISSPGP